LTSYSVFTMGPDESHYIYIGTSIDGIWTYPISDPPVINLAGSCVIKDGDARILEFNAYITDADYYSEIERVSLLYSEQDIGIQLYDDGSHGDKCANDGVFTVDIPIDESTTINGLHYSIVAVDYFGVTSRIWPYLTMR
jgi:hypothetical protein